MNENAPNVSGVADFEQAADELIQSVLLQPDSHVQFVICGSRANQLPTTGDVDPCVLDLEIIPTLDWLGETELQSAEQKHRGAQKASHCSVRSGAVA